MEIPTSNPEIIIDGANFSDLETFFVEIDRVLTNGLGWKTGHNLDAFNDLLRGGFGVFEYEEPVNITWINFSRSRQLLGEPLIAELLEIIAEHEHIQFKTVE